MHQPETPWSRECGEVGKSLSLCACLGDESRYKSVTSHPSSGPTPPCCTKATATDGSTTIQHLLDMLTDFLHQVGCYASKTLFEWLILAREYLNDEFRSIGASDLCGSKEKI